MDLSDLDEDYFPLKSHYAQTSYSICRLVTATKIHNYTKLLFLNEFRFHTFSSLNGKWITVLPWCRLKSGSHLYADTVTCPCICIVPLPTGNLELCVLCLERTYQFIDNSMKFWLIITNLIVCIWLTHVNSTLQII